MIGKDLGPYRLLSELGSGGMGTVFLAEVMGEAPGVERGAKVAIKVVHPHLLSTPGFFKRFLREAELGRQVQHENVVRTFDVDATLLDDKQVNYMAMEYVEGRSLRELLNDLGTVPEALLREIALQTAAGLAAIHENDIVHRDLKPENVLITNDQRVRIMDLGVAKLQEASIAITRDGQFAGSVLYAAPEQCAGTDVGPAADLYSLGVMLYELATGQNPFRRDDAVAVIKAHMSMTPPRMSERNPEISQFLSEMARTCLAKEASARFESAVQLRGVLEEAERSEWWAEREQALRTQVRQLPQIQVRRETDLHGREDEMKDLVAAWEQAQEGRGSTVLLGGEPGIGKTRLVDAFLRKIAADGDAHVLYGSYPPGGGVGGLSAAVAKHFGAAGLEQALAPYLTVTSTLIPAFAALVKQESLPTGAEPLQGDALHTVFCSLAAALAEEKPTLWVIDDLHYAREDARKIALSLARSIGESRVLLVMTTRPDLPEEEFAHFSRLHNLKRLKLGRLSPREVIELLGDTFKSEALATKLGGQIAYKSDGVPLFVFEMVRGLKDGGQLKQRADGSFAETGAISEIEVPSAVRDLIEARLSELTDEDHDLLDVASVQGFEFDPDLVARVCDVRRVKVLQRLAALERRSGVIRSGADTCRFDHHQIQEVLYRDLMPKLRAEYHAMLADALVERDGLEAGEKCPGEAAVFVSRHHLEGNTPKRALPYLTRALDHMGTSYQNELAVELAEQALSVDGLLQPKERVLVRLQEADRLGLLGHRDDERKALDEARRLADELGDPELRSQVLWGLGTHLQFLSDYDKAMGLLSETLELAREGEDKAKECQCLRVIGNISFELGRNQEAHGQYEKSLSIAQSIDDRASITAATINLGNVSIPMGRYAESREHSRAGLELARELRHRVYEGIAAANLGHACIQLGRLVEAASSIEEALATVRAIGDRRMLGESLNYLAELRVQEGSPEDAERAFADALVTLREIGYRKVVGETLVGLGRFLIRQGRFGEALGHLGEAREIGLEIDVAEVVVLASAYLALSPDQDVAEARSTFETREPLLGIPARMEARHALWKAGSDPADLREAHELLDFLSEHAPEDCRESMIENVPLHREIAEAWKEHGS